MKNKAATTYLIFYDSISASLSRILMEFWKVYFIIIAKNKHTPYIKMKGDNCRNDILRDILTLCKVGNGDSF